MNQERRKRLAAIRRQFKDLEPLLMELRDEEQDALDAVPENLQTSRRALELEQSADDVNGALEACAEAIQYLDSIEGVQGLAEAKQ